MPQRRRLAIVLALAIAIAAPSAQRRAGPEPIVVLVSLDGWRWDYIQRPPAANLRALAARGVRAERMIPSFPVLTFPNHYTIVTGLYPEHHGIVANNMNDSAIGRRFTMSAETAKDPRWWGGEPLWVTLVKAGRRTAAMFWPGTEVAIGGVRPTFWQPYTKAIPSPERVRQVLQWLTLPDGERPSFITLYFDEVDTAGHDFGPDSPQLAQAVANLDDAIGQLVAGVRRLGLDNRTTFVVVSDHGMSRLSLNRVVYLDDYVDPGSIDITEMHGFVALEPKDGDVEAVYRKLHGKHQALTVYKREQVPLRLHYRDNPRIEPIIGTLRTGWAASTHERMDQRGLDVGTHGFDPDSRDMGALFIAAGAGVRRGVVIRPFHNVDVYDVLCTLVGVAPRPNDGDASTARLILAPAKAAASTPPPRQPPHR